MQHKLFLGLILSSFLAMTMAAPRAIDSRIQGEMIAEGWQMLPLKVGLKGRVGLPTNGEDWIGFITGA
ncbi:hypothetical protein B0H13DRAFT_2356140 [Mycena leptocephala]|nr:hypothetical protein B0H13DRAFT_2356140 [Mycena leptocephala]